MSNMADSFYNAWVQVMQPAEFRLYCTWHVDRAWRKNLNKINSKEKQVAVYRELRTLMQETDVNAFSLMIEKCINSLLADADTIEFGKYFQMQYANKVTSWAYSYRLHSGLNTNMHIERMHRTIKYIYLKGKNVQRLDKAIHAILRFVRDKMFERLILLNKGKLCSKIKELRKRHKISTNLDLDLVIIREFGWEVLSSTNEEVYVVEEANKHCRCKLLCTECNACLHHFSCTCIDSAVKWNMCKQIHLVCKYQQSPTMKIDTPEKDQQIISDDEQNLVTLILSQADELLTNNLEDQKRKYIDGVLKKLQTINSIEELEMCKKLTAPIGPTLAALRDKSHVQPILPITKVPHNKKILQQRRLYATKKSCKKVKKMLNSNLTQTDRNSIAVQLLKQ